MKLKNVILSCCLFMSVQVMSQTTIDSLFNAADEYSKELFFKQRF